MKPNCEQCKGAGRVMTSGNCLWEDCDVCLKYDAVEAYKQELAARIRMKIEYLEAFYYGDHNMMNPVTAPLRQLLHDEFNQK